MSLATIPEGFRGLRACLLCSMIKSLDQFDNQGCSNCEDYLHMKGDRDRVYECTSANFDGMIALMEPPESWVAKWQQIGRFERGMYAISVTGKLPPHLIRELRMKGVNYKSRERTQKV